MKYTRTLHYWTGFASCLLHFGLVRKWVTNSPFQSTSLPWVVRAALLCCPSWWEPIRRSKRRWKERNRRPTQSPSQPNAWWSCTQHPCTHCPAPRYCLRIETPAVRRKEDGWKGNTSSISETTCTHQDVVAGAVFFVVRLLNLHIERTNKVIYCNDGSRKSLHVRFLWTKQKYFESDRKVVTPSLELDDILSYRWAAVVWSSFTSFWFKIPRDINVCRMYWWYSSISAV